MVGFFVVLCYTLTAYGACNVIAFSDGPFYIFARLREITYNIHPHFGKLFSCMMCLPANFGWICSLVNWFFIPIAFTPFNIIFGACPNLWWLALLCDGAFTTGMVYLIYILNEYFEKKIDFYEKNTYRDETNTGGFDEMNENFVVDDITIKRNDNYGRE